MHHMLRQRQPGRCPKTARQAWLTQARLTSFPASPQTQSPATHVRRRRRPRRAPALLVSAPDYHHAPSPCKYALSLSLPHSFHLSLLISSASTASAARVRSLNFSFSTPLWPAGDSQAAAREASGSFIHPAAVVHPDAAIGQVKPPAFAPTHWSLS